MVNKDDGGVLSSYVESQGRVEGVSVEADVEHVQPVVLPGQGLIKIAR